MAENGTDLVQLEANEVRTLTPAEAGSQLKGIRALQTVIKDNMIDKHDYGTIPGTGKPTLFKAGAEKIVTIFQARPRFILAEKIEDWNEDAPLFYYHYKCEIVHIQSGQVIGEGEGSCNSKESKYANNKGGIYSLINTIQKMAMKRAMVAAALVLGRLSDLFTQDLEDMDEPQQSQKKTSKPTTKSTKTSTKTRSNTASTEKTENGDGFSAMDKFIQSEEPDWTYFWVTMRQLGVDKEKVHEELGTESVKDISKTDLNDYLQMKYVDKFGTTRDVSDAPS